MTLRVVDEMLKEGGDPGVSRGSTDLAKLLSTSATTDSDIGLLSGEGSVGECGRLKGSLTSGKEGINKILDISTLVKGDTTGTIIYIYLMD